MLRVNQLLGTKKTHIWNIILWKCQFNPVLLSFASTDIVFFEHSLCTGYPALHGGCGGTKINHIVIWCSGNESSNRRDKMKSEYYDRKAVLYDR